MNISILAEHWAHIDAAAHELFSPLTTEAQYRTVLDAVRAMVRYVSEESGGTPHPLDTLIDLLSDRLEAYETALLGPPAETSAEAP